MAGPAFSPQQEPAQHRYVVVGANRLLAAGAARPWPDDGQVFGNAGDANIQEATDDDAKKKKEKGDHPLTVPQA